MELIMINPVDDFYERLPRIQREFEEQYNKPGKRGRPRKNKMYFTPVTEEAIIAYNTEEDEILKNRVYKEHIHYPLYKMAENLIHRFKFYYMDGTPEDVKYEVITFLLEKLNKYTQDKGRAFSYFSIVAKNYLIQNNNKSYKRLISKTDTLAIDNQRNVMNEIVRSGNLQMVNSFMDRFIDYYDNKIEEVYRSERDRRIAYAVLELFKNRENIENYNKKALYIMIREMTGTKTQYITKVVNEIKSEYRKLFILFEDGKIQ
tara:strand:+ start:9567 stop:10346 length:780 start_codon:yes stop_codon:yes gene_type:complete